MDTKEAPAQCWQDDMSIEQINRFDSEWEDFIDSKPVIRRRDGLAYLMRCGESRVPCSRYGTRSSDCAEVAWRLSYIMARETGEPITADTLEYHMGLVVNDHDDVAHMIREYGHGTYR